jgi:hypothetical protein
VKLLLRRHGDGIGDWFLMLQAMKHVNVQHPGVELYVDFTLEPRGRRKPRDLSPLVREAFEASDVRWKPITSGVLGCVTVPHLVYGRTEARPYAEGMVAALAEAASLELVYDVRCRPCFTLPEMECFPYFALGTQSKPDNAFKNWGIENFQRLSRRIVVELGHRVIQVGARDEYRLTGFAVGARLGGSFATVASLIGQARAFIGLENGLAVLANFLGVPHFIAYPSGRGFGRLDGELVTAMVRPSVDDVFNYCKELTC